MPGSQGPVAAVALAVFAVAVAVLAAAPAAANPPTAFNPIQEPPDPEGKSTWSLNYSKAGVDTGEIVIRGGSHLDFSFIPDQVYVDGRLVASARGRSLRSITIPGIPGTGRNRVRLYEYHRKRLVRRVNRTVRGCGGYTT